ncbi:NTP transferase domain-containing protein [Nanoarchaeota archaeon]
MEAIILAAGMGTRLKEILNGKPKPLLEIKGKPLIQYSLEALAAAGVKKATIALGFKGEIIKEYLEKWKGDIELSYVFNKSYETTGSMHSLYTALRNSKECLVLDGDIVYDGEIINKLINSDDKSKVVLTKCCGSNDEVYVLLDSSNKITYLGKKNPGKNPFEFTGISKFSKEFMDIMFNLHKENLEQGNLDEYYEDCAYNASKISPWYGFVDLNLAWSEIDKKEDIPRALKSIENQ